MKKLLIVYAHPDDESFGSGGLIAKYTRLGVQVDYVCATDGDAGTPSDAIKGQTESLANIRIKELECAKLVLGLNQVIRLGYDDSGMMGSESNNNPDSLWYQWQNNRNTVIQKLVNVLYDIQPHAIVTFNRYGGYGHPDHIAIQQATTEAFKSVVNDDTDQPQKLYYASIPAAKFLRFYLWTLQLRGHDIRRMGVNRDLDYQAVLDNLEPIHTMIDLSDVMDIWDKAAECHVSQGQGKGSGTRGMMASLPRWLRHRLASHYGLTRVYPEPAENQVDEIDLFDNVEVS